MKSSTWLLLLYRLPMKRTSARVNLWRRLKKFGAVPLKTSAYVLPDDPVQYERFQWLAEEIRDSGGEATLIRVSEIAGMGSQQIVKLFNQARSDEYKQFVHKCRQALNHGKQQHRADSLRRQLEPLRRRFAEISQVDYFKAPAASDARMA